MDDAEFERWLATSWGRAEDRVYVSPHTLSPTFLSPEQSRRLALRLLSLSGHAPGPLPAGELEAIRARAEAATPGPWDSGKGNSRSAQVRLEGGYINVVLTDFYSASKDTAEFVAHARVDVPTLLAALDAALADLAAAEGALHDLTSPESGEANAAYLRGVEDGVRRCTGVMRKKVESLRKDARKRPDSELAFVYREIVDVLVEIATRIEKEPADG